MSTDIRQLTSSRLQLLRVRLPVLISAAVIFVFATFLWVAYRAVERASLSAAADRAQAADQWASLLAQSTQQRLAEIRRVASLPPVHEYLQSPSDEAREGAHAALMKLVGPGPGVVELWTRRGSRVLTVGSSASVDNALQTSAKPAEPGIHPLQVLGGVVFSEAVVQVPAIGAVGSDRDTTSGGFVVVRRAATVSPTRDVLNRMTGSGAVVKLGNAADSV